MREPLMLLCVLTFTTLFSQEQRTVPIEKINVRSRPGVAPSLNDSVKVTQLLDKAAEIYLTSPDKAVAYAKESITLSRSIGYTRQLGSAYNIMGVVHDTKSDYKQALNFYIIGLNESRKAGNKIDEERTNYNIGVLYGKQANYPEALRYMLEGLRIAKAEKDNMGIVGGYNNIGVLHTEQSNYREALANFFSAVALLKKLNLNTYTGTIYQNIGEIYMKQQRLPEALKYFNEGLKASIGAEDREAEANNYHGIGLVQLQQDQAEAAIVTFKKALAIRLSSKEAYGIASSYITLGEAYHKSGDLALSLQNLQKGLALVKQSGELDLAKQAYQHLAEVNRSIGNYRLAYEYQKLFKQTTDSIFNIEKDKKLTEVQMNYEFNKRQSDAKALQQKKDAATLVAANRQRTLSYGVAIALVIVSGVAFTIHQNLRKNKKQGKLIEEQNQQIQSSLTEKETLLREIHHRVKNNLQIISSLLNIQSEDITDAKVLLSIQEGRSRVEAMSLIHQNLYQSELLNNVDIENYIKELCAYLAMMYRRDGDNIEVGIVTGGLRFDVDTAIPLGLIVNELVSNAFKYAFAPAVTGYINISISAKNETEYELKVSNDGKPLPADFEIGASKSLGLKLVSMLSRQLRGKFSAASTDKITIFTVVFKDLKAWQAIN
ncbi:MAG TPA: tetratricopeptide repeat protein [Flavobacterium sp.]|nr:tetratricopeptide repeat protein [Flavobacterium sp.]